MKEAKLESKEKCKRCLSGEQCYSIENCDHYSPLDDEFNEDRYIEERRQDFYEEWLKYIGEQGVFNF